MYGSYSSTTLAQRATVAEPAPRVRRVEPREKQRQVRLREGAEGEQGRVEHVAFGHGFRFTKLEDLGFAGYFQSFGLSSATCMCGASGVRFASFAQRAYDSKFGGLHELPLWGFHAVAPRSQLHRLLGRLPRFPAQLLASTESMRRESEKGDALRRAAQADTQRLERLAQVVASAVKDVSMATATTLPPAVPYRSCARRAILRAEIEQVNSTLQAELAKLDALTLSERASCVKALETLLLRHDLPHTRRSFSFQIKSSAPYAARLRATTPFGVAATLELDVPASHLFGHALRVDRVVERIEVQAPDGGGWLHKEGRIRPHRLEKFYVSQLELDAAESSIKLRSNVDGSGAGFDVIFRAEEPHVRLARVGDRDAAGEQPFDVAEADAANLLKLLEKLEAPAVDLAGHRRSLLQATLDHRPLGDHESPSVLVERLVAAMAPVTQEIARRSPSTTELVLKRLVSGGRREEIFVAKAELVKRLDHLPMHLRAIFGPLGLGEAGAASAAPHGGEPATLVMAKRSSAPEAQAVAVSHQVDVGVSDAPVVPNGHRGAESSRGSSGAT